MTKVTIDRELLERVAKPVLFRSNEDAHADACAELRAILAAPRQPEGEAISRERVQAEADAFFDWPTTDKSSVTTTSCLIFARCIAGMVAAERDATIAELREECNTLRQQLAERDAQIASMRAEVTPFIETHWVPVARQRDKLADLLQEVVSEYVHGTMAGMSALVARIDATLDEVK